MFSNRPKLSGDEQPDLATAGGLSSTPEGSESKGDSRRGPPHHGPKSDGITSSSLKVPPSLPNLSLPSGGGAIRDIGEKFDVNAATGTAAVGIPIALTPSRGSTQPSLGLKYNSGAGNGPFGLGWTVGFTSISRKTDKGLPRYADASGNQEDGDVFVMNGEDLVPLFEKDQSGSTKIGTNGRPVIVETETNDWLVRRYEPRIEGAFDRIERWTRTSQLGEVYWRTISRDNMTSIYGRDDSSRIFTFDKPSLTKHTFTWLLAEMYTPDGNAVLYTYKAEDSVNVALNSACEQRRTDESRATGRYLKSMRYGNIAPNRDAQSWSSFSPSILPSNGWMFSVIFDYGEHDADVPTTAEVNPWPARQDPFSTFRSGFEVRVYRLCRRILMFHHFPDDLKVIDYLVRATNITYDENPVASLLSQVQNVGYVWNATQAAYTTDVLPPLQFSYTRFPSEEDLQQLSVQDVDPSSLENLPIGIDGSSYMWIDLDGEGLSGVFAEQGSAWFYKKNLSANNFKETAQKAWTATPKFAPLQVLPSKPGVEFSDDTCMFLDVSGNGQLDVLVKDDRGWGFYERRYDGSGWEDFRTFDNFPNINAHDPEVKIIDVTGNGLPDILVSEDDVFTWYPSLGEYGYGPAERAPKGLDDGNGPRVIFSDPELTIYLADMSGDGLMDILRVRNSDVAYWPNLGYGRFGAKIIMDNAPLFTSVDMFNQRNVIVADIDGSGTTDIIYVGIDGVDIFINQAGNGFQDRIRLAAVQPIDDISSVIAADLLGNGTTCLVWSTPLPCHPAMQMRYMDLMQGIKPRLLSTMTNNLGAETRLHYASSTKFFLDDRQAGREWVTRLNFPVHCVERVELFDGVSQNRFVTRYAYHDGFFDGYEREFRGFAMVEQWDTEDFGIMSVDSTFGVPGENVKAEWHVPPALTKSWFHTGAFIGGDKISRYLAHQYFGAPPDADDTGQAFEAFWASLLPDTIMPGPMTPSQMREATRALKGKLLRKEIYSIDGSPQEKIPYVIAESNFTLNSIQQLQDLHLHGVFSVHPRETIAYNIERSLDDQRIQHELALELDQYGNLLKSLTIQYGRRPGKSPLGTADAAIQESAVFTYSETSWTSTIDQADDYILPQQWESRIYQLHGFESETTETVNYGRFASDNCALITQLTEIPYEQPPSPNIKEKRMIGRSRMLYRSNDLSTLLEGGTLESLAIIGENYQLVFTAGLLQKVFQMPQGGGVTQSLLPNIQDIMGGTGDSQGCYVNLDGDGNWWIPSGRSYFHTNPQSTPLQELVEARSHFFLCRRHTDPAGNSNTAYYDGYDLLPVKGTDALGNTTTMQNDYRVCSPNLATDYNGNRSQCAFDEHGQVVGTAVMGKITENLGDSLDGFTALLTEAEIDQLFQNPTGPIASQLLGNATTRTVWDRRRYWTTSTSAAGGVPEPTWSAYLAREQHVSDSVGTPAKIRITISYSDGYGHEIQRKVETEPGTLEPGGPTVSPMWVGTGWQILNNKGKPVKTYEPFFDDTHNFKFDEKIGVATTILYDPLGRQVGGIHPNHTWAKTVLNPWDETVWDTNDNVLISDPKTDPDVGDFFKLLPSVAYLPSWYDARSQGQLGPEELSSAKKTAAHANTPSVIYADPLGRPLLKVVDNGAGGKYATRSLLDVQGRLVTTVDAQGRTVETNDYDMLGNQIHTASMDTAERWYLMDVFGQVFLRWDSRNQKFRKSHDALRRPLAVFLTEPGAAEICIEKTLYGEGQPDAAAHNQLGRAVKVVDQGGVIQNPDYDFKGNLTRTIRQFATEYKKTLDWNSDVALDTATYESTDQFDAFNRQVRMVCPDQTVIRYSYNITTLLSGIDVNVRGEQQNGEPLYTTTVKDITYDSKGQRLTIAYGNGVSTAYTYDSMTFNLNQVQTSRGTDILQNLFYFYDPMNNVTRIRDGAQQVLFFRNQIVDPTVDYTYDAVYRLVAASGREQLGQANGQRNAPSPAGPWNTFQTRLTSPGDGNAMGTYLETYIYDAVDNILSLRHAGSDPANPGWTQIYTYSSPSLLEPSTMNNRLSATSIGSATDTYAYDGLEGLHGNMTGMPHLSMMSWNYKDQLSATARQVVANGGTPETTYYVYNTDGARVRKITERQAASGQVPIKLKERLSVGLCETYREYNGDGTVKLEKDTLSILDDKKRVALIETRSITSSSSAASLPTRLFRYQFANQLGSAMLELDDTAQILSYEEYTPFGSSSYQAVRSQTDAPKRYRFMGKERDEESGFYYHGHRYYAPWIGRWTNADPIGLDDGLNVFGFVADNPVTNSDPTGTAKKKQMPEADPEIVQHNQNAADYAKKASGAAAQRNPDRINPADPGSRGKLHHEFVDRYVDRAANGADPDSVESRTVHNVAIKPIGKNKGIVMSVGKGVRSDNNMDNLDTVTAKKGSTVQEGMIVSHGEFEHVGEHKSNGGLIKPEQARWGETHGTYKPGKLPNLKGMASSAKSKLKAVAGAVKKAVTVGKKGGGDEVESGGGGGGGGMKGGGGGGGMGGGGGGLVYRMSPAAEGVGRNIFPVVPEATDFADDMTMYLRATGRQGADLTQDMGDTGRVILVAGAAGGVPGALAERAAEKLGVPNPELVGQTTSLGLGATVGYMMVEGAEIGVFAGPQGAAFGAVVGGLAGLAAFYLIR